MIINVILLLGGLVLILSGANFLTDGAAALAKRFNISSLVIGLTIVAFGTSAPELTVSVVSAINGSAELAIGNVVGSNIFNILMIVGVTAVVAPIRITRGTLTKEIPLSDIRWPAVCRRVERDSPFAGSRRVDYRSDTGGHGYLVARVGYFGGSGIEEESRDCYR